MNREDKQSKEQDKMVHLKYLQKYQEKKELIAPGHAYTIYLPVDKNAKGSPYYCRIINNQTKNKDFKELLEAFAVREESIMQSLNNNFWEVYTKPLKLKSALLCGSGLPHPTGVGMTLLSPYGIPYIPGSSLKGIFRDAFKNYYPDKELLENLLFGVGSSNESQSTDYPLGQGHWRFLDAIIEPNSDGQIFDLDVLTLHHKKYFRGCELSYAENPIPVFFLVVKEGCRFSVNVLHKRHDHLSSQLQEISNCKCEETINELTDYISENLGYGAKSRIGYGYALIDEEQLNELNEQRKKREKELAEEKQREFDDKKRYERYQKMTPAEQWAYKLIDKTLDADESKNESKKIKKIIQALEEEPDVEPQYYIKLGEILQKNVWKKELRDTPKAKNPKKDDDFNASKAIVSLKEGKKPNWEGR